MMENRASKPTGFHCLPAATVKELCAKAARIKSVLDRSLREVGRELIDAKGILNHGQFGDWLEREVGMSCRTAQLIMNASRLIEKNENFSLLGRSALFALGASDVPVATRAAVNRMIERGETPTCVAVKSMIAIDKQKRPNRMGVAIRAAAPPEKARVIDLETFRSLAVADGPIAVLADGEEGQNRIDDFRERMAVSELATIIGSLVDTRTMHRLVTLCRAAPLLTLTDLADALEAM